MNQPDQIWIDEFSPKYQEDILDLIVNIQLNEFGIAITAEDQPDLRNIKDFYQKGKEVYLGTTSEFFAAHRFYEKNGFCEIADKSIPSTFPIMKVDTRFYKFEL